MATISFTHAHDHAAVLFAGDLDWEASHELVTTIDTVVGQYFYTQVELIVASPGGETRAFQYYLGAVEDLRKQGVRFRTRVISSAASAAALMVSLGDERVADPGAMLLYHPARVANAGEITATLVVVAADLGEVMSVEGEDEVVEDFGELSGGLVADFIGPGEAMQVHRRSSATACSRCPALTVRASLTAAAVRA